MSRWITAGRTKTSKRCTSAVKWFIIKLYGTAGQDRRHDMLDNFDISELAHCEDHDSFDEYCRDCDAAAYGDLDDEFWDGSEDAAYDLYTGK